MNSLPLSRPSSAPQHATSQIRLDLLEKGFTVVGLLFFTDGLATVVNDSQLMLKLLRYSILLLSVLLLTARWRGTLRAISKGGVLWVLIGLMLGSIAWSISPDYTLESIRGEILPMTAFAIYVASRFTLREQLRLFAIALSIGAVLSFVYAMAIPSVGRHIGDKFDGAWKGIYVQKNQFSAVMVFTMMTFFVLGANNSNRIERWLARLGLMFSVSMILLSTSLAGLLVFIVILSCLTLFRLFRWRGFRSVLLLDLSGMLALCLAVLLLGTWQDLAVGLGKDPTLSARTHIWSGSIDKIMDRPILGYGRAAFWVPNNPKAREIGALASKGDFIPAHAHNGFLDLAIDQGLLGLGLFLIGYISTFLMAVRCAYQAKTPEDLWPLAFLILLCMNNLAETNMAVRTSLHWVTYMIVFLSMRLLPRQALEVD
ncbi:MAG: O-antigen ligase family protein [Cyanobacteria bacterium J06554_3]